MSLDIAQCSLWGRHHPKWKDTAVVCTKTRDSERQLYSSKWNMAGAEDLGVKDLNGQLDGWSVGREDMRTDDEEICYLKQKEQGFCPLGSEEPMGGWCYCSLCLVLKEGNGRLIPVGWNSGREAARRLLYPPQGLFTGV